MKEFIKEKKKLLIIIGSIILIIIVALCIFKYISKKNDYNIFLEVNLPNESTGYIKLTPGNNNETNITKDSYLLLDYYFSDNKTREFNYVIEDDSIVKIEGNKVIGLNTGTTNIYITTKYKKSNIVSINVVDDYE